MTKRTCHKDLPFMTPAAGIDVRIEPLSEATELSEVFMTDTGPSGPMSAT